MKAKKNKTGSHTTLIAHIQSRVESRRDEAYEALARIIANRAVEIFKEQKHEAQ